MQVKIRLQRFGSKKRPFYRMVAAASSQKRDGKFLDIVGLYHPISAEGSQVRLNEEKIKYWLDRGARPTDTVKEIFTKQGFWKETGEKIEAARVAGVKKRNAARKAKKSSAPQAAAQPAPSAPEGEAPQSGAES